MLHITLLILIILVAGLVGGLLRSAFADQGTQPRLTRLAHIGLGVVAAALVPLFLEVTASRILDEAPEHLRYYLVFAAMCLLFAYSADRVIERMTNQLMQQLEKRADVLAEKTTRLQEAVQAAEVDAEVATETARSSVRTASTTAQVEALIVSSPLPRLMELAREYDTIRTTERGRPSNERTRRMTQIVVEMGRIVRETSIEIPVTEYLGCAADEHGTRLIGFAYCHEKPDIGNLDALLSAIKIEDKPFGQYWGLRALERLSSLAGETEVSRIMALVNDMMSRSQLRGTDRYHILRSIANTLA